MDPVAGWTGGGGGFGGEAWKLCGWLHEKLSKLLIWVRVMRGTWNPEFIRFESTVVNDVSFNSIYHDKCKVYLYRLPALDPVILLGSYIYSTMNTLDTIEAFIAETMYNLSLPNLMCYSTGCTYCRSGDCALWLTSLEWLPYCTVRCLK